MTDVHEMTVSGTIDGAETCVIEYLLLIL